MFVPVCVTDHDKNLRISAHCRLLAHQCLLHFNTICFYAVWPKQPGLVSCFETGRQKLQVFKAK